MGRKLTCLIICLLLSCSFCLQGFCADDYEYTGKYSEGLAVAGKYVDGNLLYGFIDEAGNVVIDFKYELAWDFSDSYAKVTVDGHTYFIDKSGEIVLDVSLYDIVGSFEDGVARFCPVEGDGALWGLLLKDGTVAVEALYSEILPKTEEYYPACLNGKWGAIDKEGNKVIDFVYDDMNGFNEGLCAAKKDGVWGFVDKAGNEVIAFAFDEVGMFYNSVCAVKYKGSWGLLHRDKVFIVNPGYKFMAYMENGMYRAQDSDNKFGCIGEDGKVKIEFKYDMIFPSEGEYIKVMNIANGSERLYGYIDTLGQRRLPVMYEQADEIKDGLVRVVLNGKTGYVDLKNQPIIAPVYQELTEIDSSLFLAKRDELYGVVRKDGTVQIEIKYENPLLFTDNGLSAACLEGKWGFIDKSGNVIIDFIYESATDFDAGLSIAKKDGLYGIIDDKNNVKTPFVYKLIEKTDDNLFIAMYGSKYGVINSGGDVLYEFIYDDITGFEGGMAVALKDGLWRIIAHPYTGMEQPPSKFYYYNEPFEFETQPIQTDAGFMYPLRELCNLFGLEISWNDEYQMAEVVKYDFEYSPEGELITVTEVYNFAVEQKTGHRFEGDAFSEGCCMEKDGITYVSSEVTEALFDLYVSFDYFSGAYILTH